MRTMAACPPSSNARTCSPGSTRFARTAAGSSSLAARPGVGKTSLVRAFAASADERVAHGACESLATPTALGPLLDVADELGGDLAARLDAGAEPRRVAGALVDALRVPTVLVLEDLHWADQATLDVMRVVGRRVDGTPSLVLATYRDDEVAARHPLRAVLGELASAPGWCD